MEQLFGSKTRTKLLKLFMSNPNRSFYVREITRKIEEQINSVRRELANLLSLGVITSDSTNNKLYYEVSQEYEHYEALRMLFTGKKPTTDTSSASKKTAGKKTSKSAVAIDVDKDVWEKAGKITGLLYAGAFTRDTLSPVDVMIIGDVPVARAELAVAELEKQEGKELRYAIMDVEEWLYRRQVNDKFYAQVMSAKKQIVRDDQKLFEEK
jgi:hypothetical protein